jgi:PIN domain nuclease of toxin-antitoxin system
MAGGFPVILLDTCVLLWLAIDQTGLSEASRLILRSHAGQLYVSPISAFEIGQKVAQGKLELQLSPGQWFPRALELHGLAETSFHSRIGLEAAALPDLHRDPFDRLLVATARIQNLTLLTPDPLIRQYPGLRTQW